MSAKAFGFISALLVTMAAVRTEEEGDAEEVVSNVLGITGGSASLPCNVTPPSAGDSVVLILWYKDDVTKPVYSVDARRTSLEQARHVVSSKRARLNLEATPSLLRLNHLVEEDEGEYRCRVDFRFARSTNGLVFLQLVVPPRKPIITDQNGEILDSVIGPYNEGDDLQLVCETEEGKPLPSVTWWRGTSLLDDTFSVSSHGVVRNELQVLSLGRGDLMAVFTCQAVNNNLSLPVIAQVSVDMNFRPVVVRIDSMSRPMTVERTVEISCSAEGSKPPAILSWWKGGVRLKTHRDTVSPDGNRTTSVLLYRPAVEDNGRRLICRAENLLIAGSAIEDAFILEIYYAPQLVLRLGSKLRHFRIQEGNDVYMECDIRANPWVSDIGWTFEDRELQTNISAGLIISNQSLVLQRVHRFNRGHYACSASNSQGSGESKPLYLPIQYSPVCVPGQKSLYGVTRHESVQVTCEVEADPSDVTFQWNVNRSGESQGQVEFESEGATSTATFTAKADYDFGTLTCSASNSVGTQREPCVFTIVTAVPPESVQNCSVSNVTQHSLHLQCSEGSSGGLIQRFVLEVHDTELLRVMANLTAHSTPTFHVTDLTPGAAFVLVVYAANAKGRSQSVVIRVDTLADRYSEQHKEAIDGN